MNIEAVMGVINVGLKALGRHALCFVALFMAFGLCCWAMWLGTWNALAVAGFFGGLIFLPILSRSIRPERQSDETIP